MNKRDELQQLTEKEIDHLFAAGAWVGMGIMLIVAGLALTKRPISFAMDSWVWAIVVGVLFVGIGVAVRMGGGKPLCIKN